MPAPRSLDGPDDQAKGGHMGKEQIGAAEEARLRILIERMVREGASEAAVTRAVREASLR
jgi:hypothetical protein